MRLVMYNIVTFRFRWPRFFERLVSIFLTHTVVSLPQLVLFIGRTDLPQMVFIDQLFLMRLHTCIFRAFGIILMCIVLLEHFLLLDILGLLTTTVSPHIL